MKYLFALSLICCAYKCSSSSYSYSHTACPEYTASDEAEFKQHETAFRKQHEGREGTLQVKRINENDCETRSLSFSTYTTGQSDEEEDNE